MSDADSSTLPTTDSSQSPTPAPSDASTPSVSSPDASTGSVADSANSPAAVPDTTIPSAASSVPDDDEKKSLTSSGAATDGDGDKKSDASDVPGVATDAASAQAVGPEDVHAAGDSDAGKSSAEAEAGQDSASAPIATGDVPAASTDAAPAAPTDTSAPSTTSASVAASDDQADSSDKPTPDPLMSGELGSAPAPSGILSTDGVAAPVAAQDDEHKDADVGEGDKKDDGEDEPNKHLQGPLDAIKDITSKDSAPVLTEQQDAKDAAMERPLAAQVVDGVKGAADAVPAAAQQQMAVDRHVNNDQALMAGTLEDPTASSKDTTSPKMATGIAQGQTFSDAYDAAKTDSSAEDDDASSASDASDGDDAPSVDGTDAELSDTGADAGESDDGDDEGYFGDLRSEFAPMEELTEDGLDHLKDAAESGAKAVKTLMSVPVSVLEREHRQVVFKMQELVGELMILAGKVFKKKY